MKIFEKIFSIKNDTRKSHKIITLLGVQIKIKKSTMYKFYTKKMMAKSMCKWYKKTTGKDLNLNDPKTFNEKIQWLKLYDSTPEKTRLADKYLVRDWVKKKIGEEYLIPLLGVYSKFEDIDFDKLPDKFVLKCNHGSAYNIIVKDKNNFNIEWAKEKINRWMKEDYAYRFGFELHYSNIKRKIIIEKYIETLDDDLQDYKFLCFDGEPKYIWVDKDRYTSHKRNVYDLNWNLLADKRIDAKYDNFSDCKKPANYEKMLEFAKILSKGFSHVRVDFYEANNQLLFGEMTFTSMSGIAKITPPPLRLRAWRVNKIAG